MTRTPAELFAEIAKDDLERREPMMVSPARDEFRRDIFWLVVGGLAAFWLCVGIVIAQQWPAISAVVRGL